MVTSLQMASVRSRSRATLTAVVVPLVVFALGCSKREPQAPKPDQPAAAAPPPPAEVQREQPEVPSDKGWPGAGGAQAAGAPSADRPAEKKAASQEPAALDESARARDVNPERAPVPKQPAPAAPAKPKASSSLGRAEKEEEGDQLAEWGRSVELLERTFDQFEHAMELATPDCPAADKFRQTVCTLAEHICNLEQQVPNTIKRRCDDGRQRCEQAGQKYRARCD